MYRSEILRMSEVVPVSRINWVPESQLKTKTNAVTINDHNLALEVEEGRLFPFLYGEIYLQNNNSYLHSKKIDIKIFIKFINKL
jgi:hypothetical protein